ncbi:zinc knuckle family protein, partial [Trifolium medium]|nr:zinc knuckle family protein [Trifolium medium]
MWSVVEVGEYVPPPAKDSTKPKTPKEWTTQEYDRVLLNTRAKLFIKCALNREEHDRIMECKTAKEMWETLQNHHEGSSRVKETRIDIELKLEDLVGSLKAHESILQEDKPLKKKMVALESQTEEHSQNNAIL